MQAHPDLSVILVSWNVREHLERCLSSLERSTGVTFETFVVDNASQDGSADLVRATFPTVTLLANKQNVGFARANNQAMPQASGRHILLLNPDTVVEPSTLATTVRYLDDHPEVGVLGCTIHNDDGSIQPSVRRFPTLWSQVLILLKLHAIFPKLPLLRRYNMQDFDYTKEADVDEVKGAFFAIRRATIEAVGSLDNRFFLWFEEVDFCKRARSKGWKVRYTPTASISHTGGTSFRQLVPIEQQVIFNRSMLQYFKKHHSPVAAFFIAVLYLPSLALSLVEHLIRRVYAPKSFR